MPRNNIGWGSIYDNAIVRETVNTFADLANLAVQNVGDVALVKTTTGIYGFRKLKGLYLYDGVTWSAIPTAMIAEKIFYDNSTSGMSETTVQTAIDSLAASLGIPTGGILPFARAHSNVPTGWLYCNGAAVSRTTYSDLFAVIGTSHGEGDGSSTFHLPDLRGVSIRGVDNGRGKDPDAASRVASATGGNTGDALGTYQDDELKQHRHGVYKGSTESGGGRDAGGYPLIDTSDLTENTASDTIELTGGNETRGKNLAENFFIKT